MIKQLISDIAYDKIKLSQGLTRAKLIANEIKNDIFTNWLNKELEGYKYQDAYLPSYRKIWSLIELVIEMPNGSTHNFPVITNEDLDAKLKDAINHHYIIEPISIVESQINGMEAQKGYINLPPQLVDIVSTPYKVEIALYKGVIRKGYREIGKIHYQNVIEMTKQKLIDTLMNLNNEFPNLEDKYEMTQENNEKVQTIITTHIYGNNNPLNIANGQTVNQTDFSVSLNIDYAKLSSLGVEEPEINELKEIVTNSSDKNTFKTKVLKWLGTVTSSMTGRGLYDSLPKVTEFITNLI